ncbi:MAG: nuclear transport factor 2 family protein [Azospirillaceae bacterium]|nr:nuclear transport factor 2 family protein [Azospirillaceae bacterium]
MADIAAEARGAIAHLLTVYNTSGDRGRIDEMLAVFTPDATLEVPGATHEGRDAIGAFMRNVVAGAVGGTDLSGGSRHHLTTSRVEVDGADSARGWTYFFVMRRGTVIEEGTYIDQYVRQDGQWLIRRRRVKLAWALAD